MGEITQWSSFGSVGCKVKGDRDTLSEKLSRDWVKRGGENHQKESKNCRRKEETASGGGEGGT